jgi:hypothetical protein
LTNPAGRIDKLGAAIGVTIRDLISNIGVETLKQASADAWRLAPGTGKWGHDADNTAAMQDVFKGMQRVEVYVLSNFDFVKLYCSVYEYIPAYTLLFDMVVGRAYQTWESEVKSYFWAFTKRMLSSEHAALADPLLYELWCDFFERAEAQEVWEALVAGSPNERLLERLLEVSGPVPFSAKDRLYERLLNDVRWHHFIFRSVYHSVFDVYGRADRSKALDILGQLSVQASDKSDFAKVLEKLNAS